MTPVGDGPAVRRAFSEAARWFVDTVEAVPTDAWDRPGLGEWNVRELVAHTAPALSTVEQYLGTTADDPLDGPVEYFVRMLHAPGLHEAVAERGREAARAMGDDPAAFVSMLADRVVGLVAGSADGTSCGTAMGTMTLIDYLVTRVLELTLHTLDLCAALGRDGDAPPPPAAAEVTAVVLARLAVRTGRAGTMLRSLTGRSLAALPVNLLG